MGLMILIFGAAMLTAAVQMQRTFRESLELQHQLSSSRELSQALEQMLRVDELTGIANRRLFDDMLEKEWRRAKRERTVLSVLAVDIDHFKAYNDHYGHPAGDECIRAVARAMSDSLHRPGDLAARIGGEEFAFLLPDTPITGALRVSELIRQRVQALGLMHAGPDVTGPVTVSLGVASSENTDIGTPGDLLRAADKALYRAKNRGRNQVAVAD
jgi:diguanylate cyclase (GGDEF)-like protein